jgi:predicted nucleic acid-binding protein
VKLVVQEAETEALRDRLTGGSPVSSALMGVEALRAVARQAPQLLGPARLLLLGVDQMAITPAILADAQTVPPVELRSLDAIHLATARMLGGSLEALVTYDARLASAARAHGLEVDTPG